MVEFHTEDVMADLREIIDDRSEQVSETEMSELEEIVDNTLSTLQDAGVETIGEFTEHVGLDTSLLSETEFEPDTEITSEDIAATVHAVHRSGHNHMNPYTEMKPAEFKALQKYLHHLSGN